MKGKSQGHSSLIDPEPVLTAQLFPEILDGLIRLLSGLEDPEWSIPTACADWSVKDVALHLLGVEIGNISARRDGQRLGGHISHWNEIVAQVNSWNQEWVRVARRISPDLLIELLEFAGGEASRYFQTLDLFAKGGPISWAGPGPQPVWLDIAREYAERWHHQQHIRDAVGRAGLKEPQYFHPSLATFVWAMPRAFEGQDAPGGTRVTLTLTGDSGGSWTILKRAGGWQLLQGVAHDPEARVALDQDLAWGLFTKGISLDTARERTSIEGDQGLAEPFFGMVSIIA